MNVVVDLAETITLLLPTGAGDTITLLHAWVESHLALLWELSEDRQRETIIAGWRAMDRKGALIPKMHLTAYTRDGLWTNSRNLISLTETQSPTVAPGC